MKRVLLAVVLVVAACSSPAPKANNRDTMTKRQKDSVFGVSGVPGATAIGKAQRAADSLNARTQRQDSAMAKPDTSAR